MKDIALLLNEMVASGVVRTYALFGAMAQMRYTEPVATLDADVLVRLPDPDRMDALANVYKFCAQRNFRPEGEAIRVGAWPVQFIPEFSSLTAEAVDQAETADFDGVPLRVVSAAHLAVIALSVGRAKDYMRILSLLESGRINKQSIQALAARHGLAQAYDTFTRRFLGDERA